MKAINYEIDFYKIEKNGFESKDLAFENLCKEFLEQKFGCEEQFQLDNNYQALESAPIKDKEGNYISFQSKLVKTNIFQSINKSFFDKSKKCKIKESDLNILNIIYIFSAEKINELDQEKITKSLKNVKSSLDIIYYTGENFKKELKLKEFFKLRQKYFYNRQAEKEFHEGNYNKDGLNIQIDPLRDIEGMTNKKDKNIALEIYSSYQGNKLCYAGSDSFDIITDIEDEVLRLKGKTFERQSDRNNLDFYDFIEQTRKEIENIKDVLCDRIIFLLSEDELKRGVVIQHHADRKATIKIKGKKCVYTINK